MADGDDTTVVSSEVGRSYDAALAQGRGGGGGKPGGAVVGDGRDDDNEVGVYSVRGVRVEGEGGRDGQRFVAG